MPWNEVSIVSLRREFISLAQRPEANISQLCVDFDISRKTAYKWLHRFNQGGEEALKDQSKQPITSPSKTSKAIEALIIQQRIRHPAWGGRKLKRSLENEGYTELPSPSTITEILRRNQVLLNEFSASSKPFIRFEHAEPNDLWQMDFKGPIPIRKGEAHALTILDDHSRFSLGIQICDKQIYPDTKAALTRVFRRYGKPFRMTMDNGNPWGNPHGRWTRFAAWLIDQDIQVSYSRPYHPQTQGKDERFHRTLKIELLSTRTFQSTDELQVSCENWRHLYNQKRPHDALRLNVPASRYRSSSRKYNENVKPYEYAPGDHVRKVNQSGQTSFDGKIIKVSEAFRGRLVGIRPSTKDGQFDVYYRHQKVCSINLRNQKV